MCSETGCMPLPMPNMKNSTTNNNTDHDNREIRAVLYAERITDMPLIEGYSLGEQITRMQQFCRINGFSIVGTYRDTVSSDVPEQKRPGYRQMLREMDKCPKRANTLLVVTWRHFCRDYETARMLHSLFRANGIYVQAIDEPLRTNGVVAEKVLAHYYEVASDVN